MGDEGQEGGIFHEQRKLTWKESIFRSIDLGIPVRCCGRAPPVPTGLEAPLLTLIMFAQR
jgi:hypothetical protein